MRVRWRLALPLLGLMPFVFMSYRSIRWNHEFHRGQPGRYFWWASIRLDADPLNRHPMASMSCGNGGEDCTGWDPESIWITPGWMERALVLSAFPAFVFSLAIVHGLARLGVSQIVSFMSFTPVFILAWFYFVGSLLDRWKYKRSVSRAGPNP